MRKLHYCANCSARFYPQNVIKCSTCGKAFCPECDGCHCTNSLKSKNKNVFNSLKIKNIAPEPENTKFEVTGTLSPLKGQKRIKTKNGPIIMSEFEFSDETGKIPLFFWGPLPMEIFHTRYEFNQCAIQGVKVKFFNQQPQLNVLKYAKVYRYQLKNKPLSLFLNA